MTIARGSWGRQGASAARGRLRRRAIGVLGTAWALAGEWIALSGGADPAAVVLDLAIGLTYLYGGLAIWGRAPANGTGRKMTAVGLTWFLGTLAWSSTPVVREIGFVLQDLDAVFLLTVVLSYPGGRLQPGIDRLGIAVMLVGTTGLNVLYALSALSTGAVDPSLLYGALAIAVMASALVLRRWLVAPARARSDLLPVLLAGAVYLLTIGVNIVRRIALVSDATSALLIAIVDLAPAAIPVALLVGFYRQSERRLQALVDAIPDPIARLGRDGAPLDEDATDGQGAGSADVALAAGGEAARAAIGRALWRGRLESLDLAVDLPEGRRELEMRLAPSGPDEVIAIVRDFTEQREAEAEVRRSRARIVEAADAERRRVERNLHDGAQQRLVALSLTLRRAQGQLEAGADRETAATLGEASAQLKAALAELRELARGIHPAVLSEAGLAAAIRSLAAESPVAVHLALDVPAGLSSHVEAAAYYVVAEALTNVAKYAGASRVVVRAGPPEGGGPGVSGGLGGPGGPGGLVVEVEDDGRGGADPAAGTGLRGLEDRVAALGGRLSVRSPVGEGTLVSASFPGTPAD